MHLFGIGRNKNRGISILTFKNGQSVSCIYFYHKPKQIRMFEYTSDRFGYKKTHISGQVLGSWTWISVFILKFG